MRIDVYRVNDWPDGWRVWIVSYAGDVKPPTMGYRVAEWMGRWNKCALYARHDVSEATWSAALLYAQKHSEMSF